MNESLYFRPLMAGKTFARHPVDVPASWRGPSVERAVLIPRETCWYVDMRPGRFYAYLPKKLSEVDARRAADILLEVTNLRRIHE